METIQKQLNDANQSKNDKSKKTTGLQEDEEMIIETSEDLEVVKSFDDLGLREELLRGKYSL
jgi:hypothetical protein